MNARKSRTSSCGTLLGCGSTYMTSRGYPDIGTPEPRDDRLLSSSTTQAAGWKIHGRQAQHGRRLPRVHQARKPRHLRPKIPGSPLLGTWRILGAQRLLRAMSARLFFLKIERPLPILPRHQDGALAGKSLPKAPPRQRGTMHRLLPRRRCPLNPTKTSMPDGEPQIHLHHPRAPHRLGSASASRRIEEHSPLLSRQMIEIPPLLHRDQALTSTPWIFQISPSSMPKSPSFGSDFGGFSSPFVSSDPWDAGGGHERLTNDDWGDGRRESATAGETTPPEQDGDDTWGSGRPAAEAPTKSTAEAGLGSGAANGRAQRTQC